MLNASRGAQPVGAEDPLASTVLHLNQGRRARRLSTPRNTRLCIALRIVARRDPALRSEAPLPRAIGSRAMRANRASEADDLHSRSQQGGLGRALRRHLDRRGPRSRAAGRAPAAQRPGPRLPMHAVDPAPLTGSPASGESRACRCGGRRPAWPPGHVQSPAGASSARGREVGGTLKMRVVPAEQVCRDRSLAPPRD